MLTQSMHNRRSICLALTIGIALPIAIALPATRTSAAPGKTATAKLLDAKKQAIGTVKFAETPKGLQATVEVKGLNPGEHAIHVHEFGKCDPPNFLSAGEHFDPSKTTKKPKHEAKTKGKTPAGDLPNIKVKSDGTGTLTAILPGLNLGNGSNSLLKPGGTAVIVHAGANGKSTIPGVDAKTRIACGVVTP
ncbi:superoxide dismutase family protein [Pseudanabaena sp. PCC 6802]|uniref:superoxide dismutase family protein n=1 Tax=Pseudanabaena sp. PCC 6802 TaxID=118173 RepID=UPI000348ED39|nr:superoxide dismutase family protein [Pseudanabaena sp. PCC 6802]